MPKSRKLLHQVSLNCYTIRFNKKYSKEICSIADVFGVSGFKNQMKKFAETYQSLAYTNDAQDRMLYLVETLSLQRFIFSGVMKRGHNGQQSDIEELVAGIPNTISTVNPTQYNSIYFYFLVALPYPNSDYLILMVQTYKQFGIKEIFEESLKSYIGAAFNQQFACSICPLSIPKLFSKYIKEGDIRRLRFKKHSLTSNAENLLSDEDNHNAKDYEVELSVRAKKKGFMGIKNIDFDKTAFVEVYDLDFDYDDAYADVSVNGRTRIINITSPDKFTASYDLTNKIKRDPVTERPIYTELNLEAIQLLKQEILLNI